MDKVLNVPSHVPSDAVVDFDIYAPPGVEKDFHAAWKALHAEGVPDLVWTTRNGGHWIVTRGEDISALYRDWENFSSRHMWVPKERAAGNSPLPGNVDPPDQVEYKNLLNRPLSPKSVRGLEPQIRDLAASLVEGVKGNGKCEFVSEFGLILPLVIFLDYSGLPRSDLDYLRDLAEEKLRPSGKMTNAEVMGKFSDYLDAVIEERTKNPGDDLISQVVNGKVYDRPLTRDEAIRLCSQLMLAGLDTVAAALAFTMLYLARNPDLRRAMVADPSLIRVGTEDMLRRHGVLTIAREVMADYELHGVTLKKGDLIALPTPLHGLDDRIFPDPMTVDPDRPRQEIMTFAAGPHRCPGAQLARFELRAVLEEWLARIPDFDVDPAGGDIRYVGGTIGTITHLPLTWS